MDSDFEKTKQKVRRELADFLGVDMEDIDDETDLTEELHMDPSVLTDFMEVLAKAGLVIDGINLAEIETFSDLMEALTAHS